MDKNEVKIKTSIGGQALIEGIMMRGPVRTAMTVRRPDGTTVTEVTDTVTVARGIKKVPVLRGIFAFAESMIQGYKSLMRSAELAFPEDTPEAVQDGGQAAGAEPTAEDEQTGTAPAAEAAADIKAEPSAESEAEAAADIKAEADSVTDAAPAAEPAPGPEAEKKKEKETSGALTSGQMTAVMIIGVVLGFALAIFLFKFLPESIYQLLLKLFPGMDGNTYGHSLLRAALTGLLKVMILVGYMAAVSLMKDIRRTFSYHGAEHKTIFCYEKGLELTVDNVRAQRRFHPRCGTSFLILSVLVSIFVTMFIPAKLVDNNLLNVLARTGIGLLLLPITMGLGYELIRLAGRHDNAFMRVVSAPGMWLQRITTREPDDGMIECAIASIKEVIPGDGSDRI
jgi:uncharacterized protein YqhQ